jgi:3-phenylpropionate/trans-cinnamate dioxygenase ferredoxin reductase subunit
LQIVGLIHDHDTAVIRGSIANGRFSVFCFRGSKLLGIESVNQPADHMAGRRLLAAGATLSPQQAADHSFDLKAAVAQMTRSSATRASASARIPTSE